MNQEVASLENRKALQKAIQSNRVLWYKVSRSQEVRVDKHGLLIHGYLFGQQGTFRLGKVIRLAEQSSSDYLA